MSIEADLVGLLKGVCPRSFGDEAPLATPKPYVVYQFIGGMTLQALNISPTSVACACWCKVNEVN